MKQLNAFLATSVIIFLIAGCHTTKKTPALVSVNDTWILQSLNGYPLEVDSFDNEKPRLEIKTKDKLYFGYSGCNNLNGQLDITETTIHFKPGAMTRKACLEQNIEPEFLKAIASTKTYKIKKGILELFGADGKSVAKFRKAN